MQEVRSQAELARWDIKQAVAESLPIEEQETCGEVHAQAGVCASLASFYNEKEERRVRDFDL